MGLELTLGALALGLALGNVIYAAATKASMTTAFERSVFQVVALAAAWLVLYLQQRVL